MHITDARTIIEKQEALLKNLISVIKDAQMLRLARIRVETDEYPQKYGLSDPELHHEQIVG